MYLCVEGAVAEKEPFKYIERISAVFIIILYVGYLAEFVRVMKYTF